MKMNTYEYWENAKGEWNWRFRARNGEIQFQSTQGYTSKRDCIRGIHAAQRNALFARIRER